MSRSRMFLFRHWRDCLRFVMAVSLLLAVAGCGFHMQGSSPLPDDVPAVHVSYHNNYRVGEPELVRSLKQRLRRQKLLGESDAPAEIRMRDVKNIRTLSAVSPINANDAEYTLVTRAVFDYLVNGKKILSNEQVSLTQEYTVSVNQKLSARAERRQLIDDMQRDLSDRVLERISRASRDVDDPETTQDSERQPNQKSSQSPDRDDASD